ncbi:hypothetical protein CONCODRAFT_80660 [Conidiobolus coronatus NRRL 28638]|uniref:Uncharacterized protein n=1 Tax=Conidiobolus coronatus (strain ATCC 28846 / CBS 209.66 / NRRL 28638) TaxID=796925 RepID=A0A137NT13_CONC2|nr:hypothetical protein CONCODRAFT_80660 [Conidiobolus coronatus NRRL 28638]|eukprot:KXN65876.1 hypothetical protein CONCODRAFT_80660 [Conidiobolus coronatus NRRL 28638]
MGSTLAWALIRLSFALIKPGFSIYQKIKARNLTKEDSQKEFPLIDIIKTVALFAIFGGKTEIYLILYDDLIFPTLTKYEAQIFTQVNEVKGYINQNVSERILNILQFLADTTEAVIRNLVLLSLGKREGERREEDSGPTSFQDTEIVQKLGKWYDTFNNIVYSKNGNSSPQQQPNVSSRAGGSKEE